MGLDMYLERINRKAIKYDDVDFWVEEEEKNNTDLYQEIKPFLVDRGSEGYRYKSLSEEVGYWRKDNHIHNWFVKNIQGGEDDCNYYEVTPEQLNELKATCQKVLEASELVSTFAKFGSGDEMVIDDSTVAEELLPRSDGFFFGNQDYNERYYKSLKYTIDVVNEALKTDFETYAIRYCSSW